MGDWWIVRSVLFRGIMRLGDLGERKPRLEEGKVTENREKDSVKRRLEKKELG